MTSKKRQRYEQIPFFWTEMFDLHFDFVGDFSMAPSRIDLNGAYGKKRFTARYYQADRLRGLLLCNQTAKDVDTARTELRTALGK